MKKIYLLLTAMLFFALGSVLVAADTDSCIDEEGIDIEYSSQSECYDNIEYDCLEHCEYGSSECIPFEYGNCVQVEEYLWVGHCACEVQCHIYWPAYASYCTTCGDPERIVLDDDMTEEGDGCVNSQCCMDLYNTLPTVDIEDGHYNAEDGWIYPVAYSDDDPIRWYLGSPFAEMETHLGNSYSGETFSWQITQPSGTIYALVIDTTYTGLKGTDTATFSEGVPEFTIIGIIAAVSIIGIMGAVCLLMRHRRK
ncbi:hypothetical protein KY332_03105 [Candidatus Woesearchaeota archaeon]|nr:hypothetical protein [Candidatus Woesearchaeota archaeon]